MTKQYNNTRKVAAYVVPQSFGGENTVLDRVTPIIAIQKINNEPSEKLADTVWTFVLSENLQPNRIKISQSSSLNTNLSTWSTRQ